MFKQLGILTVVGLLSFAGTARANLVNNGGFETSDFTGWTHTGGHIPDDNIHQPPVIPVHGGNFAAALGPTPTDSLSQTFSTTPGDSYDVEYFLAVGPVNTGPPVSPGSEDNEFAATWDGITLEDIVNAPDQPYSEHHFTVVASTSSTTLEFDYHNTPDFFFLDDVSVTPVATTAGVPEPVSATLLGLAGAGLIGYGIKRRRA